MHVLLRLTSEVSFPVDTSTGTVMLLRGELSVSSECSAGGITTFADGDSATSVEIVHTKAMPVEGNY